MILIDITSYVDSNLYNYIRDADDLKPLMCQAIALSKVKVTLCEHAPRLPASPSLMFRFQTDSAETCFRVVHARHLALKGLKQKRTLSDCFFGSFYHWARFKSHCK